MKKEVELSRRMQAVADIVSKGNRVCDVGCDHGYVSIYLIQSRKAPSVLAMDVNKGPLMRAKEHVQQYQLEEYITLRLSDGLGAYRIGEAQTLLCAGMGGRLLRNILSKEPEKTASFQELILQPQSEIGLFRKFLREEGYLFLAENMILEDGKFYPMMKVRRQKEGESVENVSSMQLLLEDMFGPLLLKERNPVLLQFIEQELAAKITILDGLQSQERTKKIQKREQELEEEIKLYQLARKQILE